jgi:hypothetical protein
VSSEAAVCDRHGRPTRVRCPGCDTPICPRCSVRTAVSAKCQRCAGVGPAARREKVRRSVVVAVVAVAVVGLAALLSSAAIQGGDGGSRPPPTTVPGAGIGQEVRERGLAFVVTRMDCGPKELAAGPIVRRTPGRFCLLHLSVRNASPRPETFTATQQVLLDARGNRYDIDPAMTQVAPQPARGISVQRLNPGTELHSVLVYEVPEGVVPDAALLRSRPRSLGVKVRLS